MKIPRFEVIPAEKQSAIFSILKVYYQSLVSHLLKEHGNLQKKEIQNKQILLASCSLFISYHTIPFLITIPYHTNYHTISYQLPYHIIPITIPYHTNYHAILCHAICYVMPYLSSLTLASCILSVVESCLLITLCLF